jgi:hypothetical protein
MYYHMKRHAGEFTYTCTECKKGFIQKSAFLHHQAAVHHDKLPIAPACSDPQDYNTNTNHEASDEIVNNVITNEPIDNLITKPTVVTNNAIVNPYAGITYKCPCCDHSTRTKANALVHYARLHAEGWILTTRPRAAPIAPRHLARLRRICIIARGAFLPTRLIGLPFHG